ncbi:DNA pilot protein [Sigmofec virus UA08Rod_4104]|uniref:DNA pilot protein n=1 Tax=Sigmofec virus UA08Rod_4104 TaxID=2929394 RepID=A0A976N2L0_9VIRU|nr:DNA pilot protein [Sigmofec virus UA08Rod_4104]
MGFLDFLNPIGSAVGSLFGSVGNAISTNQTNKTNLRIARENRQWQTDERVAQQQWQDQQRVAQNQFSEQMYNQYSSPKAMAQQLTDAGLNPALAVDGNLGSVQASSGSSGAAPSGQSAPLPHIQPMNLAGGFQDMASAFASLAQAKKTGVETTGLENLMDTTVESAKVQLETDKFLLDIHKLYGNERARAEIAKILQDIDNGKASEDESRARIRNLGLQYKLNSKELAIFDERMDAYLDNLRSQTDLNDANASIADSTISKNNAEARKANADADSSDALRPGNVRSLELSNKNASINYYQSVMKSIIRSYFGTDDIPQDIWNRAWFKAESLLTGGDDERTEALNYIQYLAGSRDEEDLKYRINHPNTQGRSYTDGSEGKPLHMKGGDVFIPTDDGGFVVLKKDGTYIRRVPGRKRE